MTVYGNTQRSFPESSIPPSHPYSSPTALRNDSEAYMERSGCQLIGTGIAFIIFSFYYAFTDTVFTFYITTVNLDSAISFLST